MIIDFLRGFALLIAYFVVCACCALLIRRFISVPKEAFRKLLHIILLGSIFPWLYAFMDWRMSVLAAVAFAAVVYPILLLCERFPGYSELLTERKHGEIRRSLIVVFGMFAALISICWGFLGERYFVLAAILGWGFGDAAAALVGKRFGRHYLSGRLIEGRKSVEGSAAMFVTAFAAILTVMLVNNAVVWHGYLPIASLTALVCAAVELYTKNGMDTLTCPVAAAAVMIPLIRFWGGGI